MRYAAVLLLVCSQLAIAQGRSPPTCGSAAGLSYCRYTGPAPLLVMLTGLGNSMQSWPTAFVESLNELSAIIVYDRRGHGKSVALNAQPVTAKAAAADLDALLDRLGIRQRVVLVGHSLGGLYAQYFARNYPQRVAAVVLLDPASPFEPIDDPRFHTRAKLAPGSTDDLENRGVDPSVTQTRESPPFPPIPLIVVSATDHASPKDFEDEWQRIQQRTAAQSHLGRLVVAQGSGHDVHKDRPALIVDQVRRLLLELRNGR